MAMFCARAATIECEANQRCCTGTMGRWSSVSACTTAKTAECQPAFDGVAFRDGRVRYDAEAAGDILANVQAMTADCGEIQIGDDALRTVFIGTLTNGADCSAVGDDFSPTLACSPGLQCDFDFVTRRGSCRTAAGAGASCEMNPCQDGLDCDFETMTCVAPLPDGSECTFGSDCASSFCDDASMCAPDPDGGADDYCDAEAA
jgi:hypothetical protein